MAVNGESQGKYFLPKSHKLNVSEEKTGLQKQLWQPKLHLNFKWFYMGACGFFLSFKFATSLLPSLAGG